MPNVISGSHTNRNLRVLLKVASVFINSKCLIIPSPSKKLFCADLMLAQLLLHQVAALPSVPVDSSYALDIQASKTQVVRGPFSQGA